MDTRTFRTRTGSTSGGPPADEPVLNTVKVPSDPAQVIVDTASFRVEFAVPPPLSAKVLAAAVRRPTAQPTGRRSTVVWSGRTRPGDLTTRRLLQSVSFRTGDGTRPSPRVAPAAPGEAGGGGPASDEVPTVPTPQVPDTARGGQLVVRPRGAVEATAPPHERTGTRPGGADHSEPVHADDLATTRTWVAPGGFPYGIPDGEPGDTLTEAPDHAASGAGSGPGPGASDGPGADPERDGTEPSGAATERRGRRRSGGRRDDADLRTAYYPGRRMNLGVVLLPLRIFLGLTSLSAGMGKLTNPAFFDGGERGSMVSWLQSLHPWSLAAPLHEVAVAHPVGAGLTVAFLQIIVGVLTVFGLWQRVVASLGALLCAALIVTVSWRSAPVYEVPDIIYLAAWSPLIFAGAPVYSLDGRLTSEAWRQLGPRSTLAELRLRVLRRGAVLAAVLVGLALLIGSLLGGAVRSTHGTPVEEPEPAFPRDPRPGSPLATPPGPSGDRPTEDPGAVPPSRTGPPSRSSGPPPSASAPERSEASTGSSAEQHTPSQRESTSGSRSAPPPPAPRPSGSRPSDSGRGSASEQPGDGSGGGTGDSSDDRSATPDEKEQEPPGPLGGLLG